jgi:pSer/pThr/pTyr-binding forkhead associated (FHA) protein
MLAFDAGSMGHGDAGANQGVYYMSIRCPRGHDNPDGSLYCDECGERLTSTSAAMPRAAVAAPPKPRLVLQADGTTFDLEGKQEILLGREDPSSSIFPDIDLTSYGGEEGGVSRMHARIHLREGYYFVEDLNSTNCTYINRQKLAPQTPTPLNDGDELRLGRVALTFHLT